MIEDALRQALAAEANSVEVAPDALTTIRTRIARPDAEFLSQWGA